VKAACLFTRWCDGASDAGSIVSLMLTVKRWCGTAGREKAPVGGGGHGVWMEGMY